MPRRRLKYVQGGYYHIYNRGADRRTICRSDENFRFLLTLMKRYLRPLQLTIIAYCLLPNHYHWLVRQDGEAPAGLLPQRVFNAYSKAFNNTNQRTGTLFEDRYKAIRVETDAYLRHLCCYIHGNPVRHNIAAHPELWPYSNYPDWIGKRGGTMLDVSFLEEHFGSATHYQAEMRAYLTGQVQLPPGLQTYLDEL